MLARYHTENDKEVHTFKRLYDRSDTIIPIYYQKAYDLKTLVTEIPRDKESMLLSVREVLRGF